jgi:hypothetical protein
MATGSFGRFAVEMLLARVGIGFRDVPGPLAMFRRRVDRVKPQWLVAYIHDIVLGSGGHDDRVVSFDLGPIAVDPDFACPGFEAEKLIAVVMDFFPDLVARLERHQNELEMVACVQDTAKIGIFDGQRFNVADKSLHALSSKSRRQKRVANCAYS